MAVRTFSRAEPYTAHLPSPPETLLESARDMSPHDDASGAMVQTLTADLEQLRQIERDARYPDLLLGSLRDQAPVRSQMRPTNGLCVALLEQQALAEEQLRQLGAFRLRQFILCGWYDPIRVAADRLQVDPALADLPPRTLHTVVGDVDGRLLAYTCLQPAGDATTALDANDNKVFLTTPDRPQFPTERELFGSQVFTSLAALRDVPLSRIWEWACTVRNQALRTSLTPAAMYESFCAPIRFAVDPAHGIDVILGNTNLPARRVYRQLGIPGLYAPNYPVAPPQEDGYWVSSVNTQGEFWPSVMALEDVRARHDTVERVDEALSVPPEQLATALRAALSVSAATPHHFVADNDDAFWTGHNGESADSLANSARDAAQ